VRRLYLSKYCPIILLLVFAFSGGVYALQGSTAADGSNAKAVHDVNITGKGVNIGLVSLQNVFVGHNAFRDANGISHANNVNQNVTEGWHDTALAGIIISRGHFPDHPNDIGVAPDAFIYCFRIVSGSDLQPALGNLIETQHCRVIVTGFEFGDIADGQSQWTLMYDYYADVCDVVFVNAAGNAGSWITVLGDAYNGITTGGLVEVQTDIYQKVGNATNDGPTADGRRKPDVTAPSMNQVVPGYYGGDPNYWYTTAGDGATSWAVPHTAGIGALLLEYANQSPDADDGHSEVIKAVIVNSAFPNIRNRAGVPTNPADTNNTWHPQRGYGRVDALRAVETLSAGRIIRDTTVTAPAGWAYENIDPNQTHEYRFAGEKNSRFILTVTWNRVIKKPDSNDPNYRAESPRFNLDVTVKNPSGDTVYSETDDVNNLEKVELILPADGNYTVLLKNNTSKGHDYGLAFEVLPPLAGDFNIDYIVDELDLSRIACDWLTSESDTDIIPDGRVNWLDFVEFADNWFKIEPKYYNP
jgi:hypothetical protein